MSFTLFKYTLKSNWVLLVIFCAVMVMYMSMIVMMYDPEGTNVMQELLDTMPEGLVKAFNFEMFGAGLTAFLATYFYGFLIVMFPMVYCIIIANRLIAQHVDSGSMAYMLSTPNSRVRIAITQAVYILLSIAVLVCVTALTGIVSAEIMFRGELDIGTFVMLNVHALVMIWAISSICFFFSCFFSDGKNALGFGAGIPIGFFLINMLAGVSEDAKFLKSISLFALFDPAKILAGDSSVWIGFVVFLTMTVILYTAGIVVFDKKDLPL